MTQPPADISAASKLQAWLREDSKVLTEDVVPLIRFLVRDRLALPASQRDLERDATIAALRQTYDERMAGGSSRTGAIKAAAVEHGIGLTAAWAYLAE